MDVRLHLGAPGSEMSELRALRLEDVDPVSEAAAMRGGNDMIGMLARLLMRVRPGVQMGLSATGGPGSKSTAMERLVPLYRGGSRGLPLPKDHWIRQGQERQIAEGTRPPGGFNKRWFGPKEEADYYYRDAENPIMNKVLVPESVAEASRVSNLGSDVQKFSRRADREYLLPPYWARRARPVYEPDRKIKVWDDHLNQEIEMPYSEWVRGQEGQMWPLRDLDMK